jgi:membrane-associated phospholipid phosphatase
MRGRVQLGLFVAAWAIYDVARWVWAGELGPATENAHRVMDLEHATGTAVERSVQQAFDAGWATWLLSNVYLAAQLAVVPGALFVLYRRSPGVYRRLRDTILATWMISVPIFALFPCAPPRLAGIGMADTVSDQAAVALTGHSTVFYNPLAAVPSLHCGFAFAIGIALAAAARRPWTKALALSWGPIVALSVVATGNHYVFDIAAGLLVSAAGYVVGPMVAWLVASRSWQLGRPSLRVAEAAA